MSMIRLRVLALLVLLVELLGCRRDVFVSIVGQEELDGASVALDGRIVTRLEKVVSDKRTDRELGGNTPHGAVAYISVPRGDHVLTVTKAGYKPIVRRLHYASDAGEDYIALDAPDALESPRPAD